MTHNRRQFLKRLALTVTAFSASAEATNRKKNRTDKTPELGNEVPLDVLAFKRMTFGPRPEDWEEFSHLGDTPKRQMATFVEQQLYPDKIADPICDARMAKAGFITLNKTLNELWTDHVVAKPPEKTAVKDDKKSDAKPRMQEGNVRVLPLRETEAATWLRAVYSKRQLQEVLADFWHNHFNVYAGDPPVSGVFVHYDRDVIRHHMLGNFREMLETVATSPAMLHYLDNYTNQSGNPNENYARELFELHTLGAENYLGTGDRTKVPGYAQRKPIGYVDGDVYEAARCFTGWRIDQGANSGETGSFAYHEPWHDRFQKIVLGHSIKEYQPPLKDGRDVLDILAQHPGTAQYISRKLCRRFIADKPPQSVVQKAAKVFITERNSKDQLRSVLRTILLSEEFGQISREKIKRPFEAIAGMLRATNADFFPSEAFLNHYQLGGQRLFYWHTPDGYPDSKEKWASTTPMIQRWKLYNQAVVQKIDGITINWGESPKSDNTPSRIVAQWTRRLLGQELNAKDHAALIDFISEGRNPKFELPETIAAERVPALVALILMSPEYQWR
jgi:uncharacterized protein (DUF1800 family)